MIRITIALITLMIANGARAADNAVNDAATFFELKIRPVLLGTCYKCHGGDKVSAKLRIDSREALLKGGEGGPSIVPGDPQRSKLIHAIRYDDDDLEMPPKKQLSKETVANFSKWIRDGAQWPTTLASDKAIAARHWSFQPIANPKPPRDSWSPHPIDQFIRARQKPIDLKPVTPASKTHLIRRASFDLTGLPPTPEEVAAFIDDKGPAAFARVVNRLLDSPRYGERWGRHWLDLVRYADTAGENSDYPIPEAYLYRDYVIDSFNVDKPYDQFIQEQIAGDILAKRGPAEKYAERVVATGFIAQAKRFGTNKLEDMHLIVEDTIHTTGQVVLGLTLRCARCHDHKFDPTTSEDYYALYGFFQSTRYPFPGGESDKKPSEFAPIVDSHEIAKREAAYVLKNQSRVKQLKVDIAKTEKDTQEGQRVTEINQAIDSTIAAIKKNNTDKGLLNKKLIELKKQLAESKKQFAAKTKPSRDLLNQIENGRPSKHVPVAYAIREGTPVDVAIQIGGVPNHKGKVVKRNVPRFLRADTKLKIPAQSSGRLQLAEWLTNSSNPLTARVMVNRIWQHHFGKPLVATPSDFGMQGEPPTHPKLLDWLARDFIRSGYSVKAMHRRIMLSRVYQLASSTDLKNASLDAGNTKYWRFDRRRLDAESIRDSMLALSGNLDLKRPGPHPFPAKSKWRWTAHHQFKAVYPSNHRSVYLMVQRLHPHPYLALFNGPDTSASTAVRDQSTVALQSLFMLNSDFVHHQAKVLATRLLKISSDNRDRIKVAFEHIYARPPTIDETSRFLKYFNEYRTALTAENVNARQQEHEAWSSVARVLMTSNEFIYVN